MALDSTTLPTGIGLGFRFDHLTVNETQEIARYSERLGYRAIWLTDSFGRDPLIHAGQLLSATSSLTVGTAVLNIHLRTPESVGGATNTLADQSDGRFLLGIGMSHPELIEDALKRTYASPVETVTQYLEAIRATLWLGPEVSQAPPVVLGALGPKMLAAAGAHFAGAIPVQIPPELVSRARGILGPQAWLGVKQYVCLTHDHEAGLQAARARLAGSLGMRNYRRLFVSAGFTDDDLAEGGSDELCEAIVSVGSPDAIAQRATEHFEAGANHVVIEPIRVENPHLIDEEAFAPIAAATR
ncbi:MAG: TIGR03620 family F420-dependent LLM class oxidoreductase [Acidimicrobiia bacterium]|nr:TIGR03620 family F420-dependent LLM class oxidoreductase [Acidimicrobiia bacterium]